MGLRARRCSPRSSTGSCRSCRSGSQRFPVLAETGIKRWVNGAFTFTPDGNPLVGPVAGVPNYWAACGVMAGFSQGAGIGLAVANWIVDGDPGYDVFGMDVARFGPYAANDRYLARHDEQFYARRFVMAYPNEELPAGRPLKTTPCLRRVPRGGRPVHRELGAGGAAVLRALAGLRGDTTR